METPELKQLRMDSNHWKLGVIYYCKQDPRVIVRNRQMFGWTWNFGHSWALPIILMLTGFIVGGYFWFFIRTYQ